MGETQAQQTCVICFALDDTMLNRQMSCEIAYLLHDAWRKNRVHHIGGALPHIGQYMAIDV
jgi:hypothetical protein